MTGDRWTFLVMRGQGDPVQQYSLSARTLKLLAGAGYRRGHDRRDEWRRHRVGRTRSHEHAEVSRSATTLWRPSSCNSNAGSPISRAHSTGSRRTTHSSVTWPGWRSSIPRSLQAGVGGPGLGVPEASPLWTTDSLATKEIYATGYDLSALERRARLLSESLAEATDSVQAHRELLESTPSILPTRGWLTSRFSQSRMHPVHNRPLPHEGIDVSAPTGNTDRGGGEGACDPRGLGRGLWPDRRDRPRLRFHHPLWPRFKAHRTSRRRGEPWSGCRSGRQHRDHDSTDPSLRSKGERRGTGPIRLHPARLHPQLNDAGSALGVRESSRNPKLHEVDWPIFGH